MKIEEKNRIEAIKNEIKSSLRRRSFRMENILVPYEYKIHLCLISREIHRGFFLSFGTLFEPFLLFLQSHPIELVG